LQRAVGQARAAPVSQRIGQHVAVTGVNSWISGNFALDFRLDKYACKYDYPRVVGKHAFYAPLICTRRFKTLF
jgi:hypothetical protein